MKKGWKKWTEEEEVYLRANYHTLTPKEAGSILKRTPRSVAHRAKYLRLESRITKARRTLDDSFFEIIDTAEKAYILGLIAADGNIGTDGKIRIVLHSKDREHLEKVKSFFAPDYRLRKLKHANAVEFALTSQKIKNDLNVMGLYPAKTYNLEYPTNLSESMHPHFILGYFDGDGSLYFKRKYPSISFYGRKEFLEIVARIIERFTNISTTKIRQVRPEYQGFEMGYHGEKARCVCRWMGQSNLGLPRKSIKYKV